VNDYTSDDNAFLVWYPIAAGPITAIFEQPGGFIFLEQLYRSGLWHSPIRPEAFSAR